MPLGAANMLAARCKGKSATHPVRATAFDDSLGVFFPRLEVGPSQFVSRVPKTLSP